ncbi:MAG: hypothetical protein GY868_17765, partial [Deltaproteobacteria bacterium]|nr:hypothetical protein [Deltaproteobacteria bacterium]
MVCFVEKYKYLIVIFMLFIVCAGCRPGAVKNEAAFQEPVPFIYIERLIGHALDMAKTNAEESAGLPPYLEAMLADGKIIIGLGIGTDDLGRIRVPQDRQHWLWQDTFELFGQIVMIEGRLLLTRENFRSALSECEIIYLTSHSRFGAGPVFLKDGKAKPFLMQQTAGYEIVMPGLEVSGYDGTVIRRYPGPLNKKEYVVFAPDSTDLDSITPLAGYQLLVMSTCTSRRHFLDEIQTLRKGL